MRRYHLIELHEQTWFPAVWRKMFQQSMGRSIAMIEAYRHLAAPFSQFLYRTRAKAILDLCSGSAEPVVKLREWLDEPLSEADRPTIVVSDLYPNPEEFEKIKGQYGDVVDYYPEPVDALRPPPGAPPVRTMFNALHHFQPEQVKAILRDAAEKADGIAIFESTARALPSALQTLLVPFAAAVFNGFLLRPWRIHHLLWGVLVPVLPFTAFVDGMVSVVRTYTVEELEAFTKSIDVPGFEWEIGTAPMPGSPVRATYVFGWRTDLDRQLPEPEPAS